MKAWYRHAFPLPFLPADNRPSAQSLLFSSQLVICSLLCPHGVQADQTDLAELLGDLLQGTEVPLISLSLISLPNLSKPNQITETVILNMCLYTEINAVEFVHFKS